MCNILVLMILGPEWDPRRKKKKKKTEKKIENVFQEIMAENFSSLKKKHI